MPDYAGRQIDELLKYVLSCLSRQNTHFDTTKICLSRQTHFCRDKTFVAVNICRDKHNNNKLTFVTQTRVCREKNTSFVAKKICLSRINRDTFLLRQAYFCRDKHVFVATKMILVSAPANDRHRPRCPLTLPALRQQIGQQIYNLCTYAPPRPAKKRRQ